MSLAAAKPDIPYDAWWLIWFGFALLAGPALLVWAWKLKGSGASTGLTALFVIPVPIVLAWVFLAIAFSCHSFPTGTPSTRQCDPNSVTQGWLAVVLGVVVYGVVAVGLGFVAAERPVGHFVPRWMRPVTRWFLAGQQIEKPTQHRSPNDDEPNLD